MRAVFRRDTSAWLRISRGWKGGSHTSRPLHRPRLRCDSRVLEIVNQTMVDTVAQMSLGQEGRPLEHRDETAGANVPVVCIALWATLATAMASTEAWSQAYAKVG